MTRTIHHTHRQVTTATLSDFSELSDADVRDRLLEQAASLSDAPLWLLALAETGVVWGKLQKNTLITGRDVYPQHITTTLASQTLQSLRLFGPHDELMLWRDDDTWHMRRYRDAADGDSAPGSSARVAYFDETQILWGTQAEAAPDQGFTLVSDGVEELIHAVPLDSIPFAPMSAAQKHRPLRLTVRHYLNYDAEDGVVSIAGSRLVDLSVVPGSLTRRR